MACGRYPFETGPEIDLVAARQPVRSSLYLRLMDLLASARMGRLDIETLAERGAHLQMDCLLGAAAPFYLAGSVQLRDCLFIGPRALSGAFWATIGARAPRFFVLIVVEAANARALYLRSGRRIDLRDGVSGSVSHAMPVGQMPVGQGPFLALVCAEFDWSGIPQPKSAAVVPVWRRDQFTPLACSHERDMLDCLSAIMERLDCHGTALQIARQLGADGPAQVFAGRLCRDGLKQEFELTCLPCDADRPEPSLAALPGGERLSYVPGTAGFDKLCADLVTLALRC